jgi:CheY-like chemotaxis protein
MDGGFELPAVIALPGWQGGHRCLQFCQIIQRTGSKYNTIIGKDLDIDALQRSIWHDICTIWNFADMVSNLSKFEEINLLASGANWAWPEAVRRILRPRGVNLLVADGIDEFVHIIERRRIHTTIVDLDSEKSNGLATIRIIRMDYPLLPCILLASQVSAIVLGRALELDVFGVIDKPVDMCVLRQVLNRLFLKKYNSDIFAE